MKKYLWLLLLAPFLLTSFLFAGGIQQKHTAVVAAKNAAGGAAPPSEWKDDFETCSGEEIDDRTEWGTTLDVPTGQNDRGADFVCENGSEAVRNTRNGVFEFLLSEYAPTDADYTVTAEIKTDGENDHIGGICIRAENTGADGLTGYCVWIQPHTGPGGIGEMDIQEWTNGGSANLEADHDFDQDYDWTSYQTVEISISGEDITIKVEGNTEWTGQDASIAPKGSGAIITYWNNTDSNWGEFIITD